MPADAEGPCGSLSPPTMPGFLAACALILTLHLQERQSSVLGPAFLVSPSPTLPPLPSCVCTDSELTLGLGPVSTGNQHRAHDHTSLGVGGHWASPSLSRGASSPWHQLEGRVSHPNHCSWVTSPAHPGLAVPSLATDGMRADSVPFNAHVEPRRLLGHLHLHWRRHR